MKTTLLFFIVVLPIYRTSFCQESELILPFGHTQPVITMAYSKDGKYIATGGQDNDAIVWNALEGRPIRLLRGHVNWVSCAEFSSSGKYLATGSLDKSMAVWDIDKGQRKFQIVEGGSVVTVVQFSPNDSMVFVGCADGTSFLVNNEDNTILPIKESHKKETASAFPGLLLTQAEAVKCAAFSSNGRQLAFQNFQGDLEIFDIQSKKMVYKTKTAPTGTFLYKEQPFFQFVPNTNKLFIVSEQSKFLLDVNSLDTVLVIQEGKPLNLINFDISRSGESLLGITPEGHLINFNLKTGLQGSQHRLGNGFLSSKFVYKTLINASKGYLITATSLDSAIYVWKIKDGSLISKFKAGSIMGLKSNPVLDLFAIAELENNVVIRKTSDGKLYATLAGKTKELANAVVDMSNRQIIAMSKDSVIQLWSIDHANIKQNIRVASELGSSVVRLSTNGKYFYTWHGNKIFVYQASSGKLLHTLGDSMQFNLKKGTFDLVSSVRISKDEKLICASSSDHTVKVWETVSGKKQATFSLRDQPFTKVEFTADSKYVIGFSALGKIGIWHMPTGKLVDTFKTVPLSNRSFISNTRNLLGFQSLSGKISVYDIDKKSIIQQIELPDYSDFITGEFSASNKLVALLSQNTCHVASLITSSIITSISSEYSMVKAKILSDDSTLILNSSEGAMHIMNINTATEIGSLFFGDNAVFDLDATYENKYMATGSHSIFLFDFEQEKTIQLTPLGSKDFVARIDSNFYYATPDASKALSWKNGQSIYGFEQLDIRHNRPDLVLRAIGSNDASLVKSYALAYNKRLSNLGITDINRSSELSKPTSFVTNESEIQYEQTANTISLETQFKDSVAILDRFNVWVNDVPVFGLKGINIIAQQKHFIDTSITITLSQGENRIETSVLNVNGTESYRSPLFVKYTPAIPQKEKVQFIGIGINQFANADYNLTWSVKDIRDLTLKLKEHYGESISIDTLFDEKVTRENVLALKQHLMSLGEDDKVIVSYSGHGVLSKDMDYFLSTFNISFEQPEEYGLPYDDLESLMDGIRPRKKLMLIDACHSGEVDKDEIARVETVAQKLDSNGISHKSRINIVPKKTLGMNNSFELMQNLFVNVGKSTGATIISAAGGMQYAQERGDLKNGVFTYSILEAFNANESLTVSQLKKIVGERVTSLTNGLQKPTSRNETINVDWNVW